MSDHTESRPARGPQVPPNVDPEDNPAENRPDEASSEPRLLPSAHHDDSDGPGTPGADDAARSPRRTVVA